MNPKLITNQLSKKEVLEAVKHSIGTNFEEYHNLENDLLYVCIPIQLFNKNIAFLRYGIELKELSATIKEQNKIIIFISIALAIISLIATYIISKIISKPIIQISNAAERVGKGDFNTKILLNQKYKMKEISSIFNNMIFKVKSLFEEISIQKEELAGIIKSIREGLLVIDMEGKILLSNDGFKQIVKKDDILGNYYLEIIHSNNKFADFIKKTQKKRKSYFDEITLDGKYYLCSL
jgi:two-component system phosphate regulon sensor histidine kinase PhoR